MLKWPKLATDFFTCVQKWTPSLIVACFCISTFLVSKRSMEIRGTSFLSFKSSLVIRSETRIFSLTIASCTGCIGVAETTSFTRTIRLKLRPIWPVLTEESKSCSILTRQPSIRTIWCSQVWGKILPSTTFAPNRSSHRVTLRCELHHRCQVECNLHWVVVDLLETPTTNLPSTHKLHSKMKDNRIIRRQIMVPRKIISIKAVSKQKIDNLISKTNRHRKGQWQLWRWGRKIMAVKWQRVIWIKPKSRSLILKIQAFLSLSVDRLKFTSFWRNNRFNSNSFGFAKIGVSKINLL